MPHRLRSLRRHRAFLMAMLALSLVLGGALAACGTTGGATTPTSSPDDHDNAVRYWVPGSFLVGLISFDGGLQASNALTQVTPLIRAVASNRVTSTGGHLTVQPFCGSAANPLTNLSQRNCSFPNPPALMVFTHRGTSSADVAIAAFELEETVSGVVDSDNQDLTQVVQAINKEVSTGMKVSTATGSAFIAGASPDLLGTGSDLWHGSGSPGGPPTPGAGTWNSDTVIGSGGSGETVAILDTGSPPFTGECLVNNNPNAAPTASTPAAGCSFLNVSEVNFSMPEHIIATKYFSPSLNGLPTNMSFAQHGVFVAKIIQHLAPQATLELIRVLGNYGGGDLRSIIYGLFYVYQQGNLSHTIVNMSLTLQPPTECLPFLVGELPAPFFTTSANWAQCPAETVANIANNPVDARLFVPMGLVMEQMSAAGATLVAAAGNDSTSAYRLGADMPGAYCHALAVSALVGGPIGAFVSGSQSVGQLAIYSNAPALENGQCLSISLTPNVLSQPITSGSTNPFAYAAGTACSLFMDRSNPKYVNTTTESTYWSGTSFSAPVFSAEMAIAFANSSKFFPGTFQYTDPCG